MPYGENFDQKLATLREAIRQQNEFEKSENAKAAGYLKAFIDNPNLASPAEGIAGTDYSAAVKQLLQGIAQNPLNADPNRVRELLTNNPLLNEIYGKDRAQLNLMSQRIAARAATGNFDPLIDTDPRANVKKANRESDGTLVDILKGAGDYILNDVLLDKADAIQHAVTGEYLTERNRVKEDIVEADKVLDSAPSELKTGAAKAALLKNLEAESRQLQQQLMSISDPDAYASVSRQLSIVNQKINAVSESFSDAEKAAYQAGGSQYEFAQQTRYAGRERLEELTPRYQHNVDAEAEAAQMEYEELVRNGKASMMSNPVYGARYLLNQLTSPAALARNAQNILPWVAIGMAKPFFAIAGAVGLAGSVMDADNEYMDQYFEEHGTLEGYNHGLASLMNGIGFIMDLAGGKILGGLAKNNLTQMLLGEAKKVLEPALQASIATGSNAPLKAGFKTVFNNLRLDRYLIRAGEALQDKAASITARRVAAGLPDKSLLSTKPLNALGSALKGLGTAERVTGQLGKHALVSDASLAWENATATLARQVAAQNGIDEEAIAKAAIEGLASGHLGMAQGMAMAPAAKAVKETLDRNTKYLRTDKEETQNRKYYDTLTNEQKYQRATSEVSQFEDLESKIYQKEIDKLGEKAGKKFSEELTYDKSTHTLSALPDKEISEKAQKAIDKFEKKKADLKQIIDVSGERREYYQSIANTALDEMIKEKGIDAYTDSTIRSALAKRDLEDVAERLQKVKGISDKTAKLQAEMLTNKKADVTAKDIGITEEALNTADILGNDSTLLTDISGKGIYKNDDAVNALGKANFSDFQKAIDNQIGRINAQIAKEKRSAAPNTDTIAELENLNKRLENLKKDYTQDKWNNKKNALITDKDSDDYIRKMDSSILPDKKSLGITDEAQLGKTAADIENALDNIGAKKTDKNAFIDSIMQRNNHGNYIDAAGHELTEAERNAYTDKFGKYYDDYVKQLNENIESYNIRQQYKTFKSEAELRETLEKRKVEKAFDIKKVRNPKTKTDEYYAEMRKQLDSDKAADVLKSYLAHPKRTDKKELDKILNDAQSKEIIKNNTHKSLFKRVWQVLPLTGKGKPSIDNFSSKVFDSLSEADQKEILRVLERAYRAVSYTQKKVADEALKSFQISELRRYSGYKQKKQEAFVSAKKRMDFEETLKLNKKEAEKYKAFNGAELDKMKDEELAKFLVNMFQSKGILDVNNSLLQNLSDVPAQANANSNLIRDFLQNRSPDFDNQLSVLISIVNQRYNGKYADSFQEVLRFLKELQGIIQQAGIDPVERGKKLWTQETIDTSRRESFTTTDDSSKTIFRNFHDRLLELNRRFRNTVGFTHTELTNSQEIIDFNDEFLVSDLIKPEARDAFVQHTQILALEHDDDIFEAIRTRVFNHEDLWQRIAGQFYVTDRDKQITEYSDNLSWIISTSENSSVTRQFFLNNAKSAARSGRNWLDNFQREPAVNQRIIARDLMRNRLVLTQIIAPSLMPAYDPRNPSASLTLPTLDRATFENFRDTFRTSLGNHFDEGYFNYIFNDFARMTALIESADAFNLNNDAVMAYLRTVDENSEADRQATIIGASHSPQVQLYFQTVARDYFQLANKTEFASWEVPTYNQLSTALQRDGFSVDDIEFITQNYGRILYRLIAEQRYTEYQNAITNNDMNLQSDLRNRLSRAFTLRSLSIPHLTARRSVFLSENVTESTADRDFMRFRDILRQNDNYPITYDQFITYMQGNADFITRQDFDNYIYDQTNNTYYTAEPTGLGAVQKLAMAKAMCSLIVTDTNIQTDPASSNTRHPINVNPPAGVVSLSQRLKERAVQLGILRNDDFRDDRTNLHHNKLNSILDHENGWDLLINQNPSLALNQAVQLARRMAEANYGRFKLTDHFVSLIENINGDLSTAYINSVAAVTTNFFPRFTPDASDDFLDKMSALYGPAVASVYEHNEIMDKRTLALQIGGQIARKMGIIKDSPVFDNYAAEAGMHAMIMLKQQGLIEEVYIDRVTGDIIGDAASGKAKAGRIPAIRLTAQGEIIKNQIADAVTYTANNTQHFLFDEILHMDTHGSEVLRTYDNTERQTDNLGEFNTEWARLHGGAHLYPGTIDAFMNDPATLNGYPHGRVFHAGDYSLVILPARNASGVITATKHDHPEFYVFNRNGSWKSDGTQVEDGRLITLAELMREGRYLNAVQARNLFGTLLNAARNGCMYTEADVNRVDNLCQSNLVLASLIDWKDPYAESTSVYASNIHNKNVNNFRNLIKTINALCRIQDAGGHSINVFDSNVTQVRLRFDELNTVNNRLFVDSLAANYREDKLIRGLFDNGTWNDLEFTLNDASVAEADRVHGSDIGTTFFHALGMDADKIPQDADVTEGFVNLLRDSEFQNLVRHTRDLVRDAHTHNHNVDLQQILEQVRRFNEQNARRDNPLTYTVTKVAKHANKAEPISLLVENSSRSSSGIAQFLNFCSQIEINGQDIVTFGLDRFADAVENNRQLTISNWTMRCEIDGLTNGPSVKANAVGLKENRDPFSKIMLGSVGINSRFVNVFEAQQAGLLDVYLLATDVANANIAEDVITKFINSRGKNDTTLPYIASVYNKQTNTTDYVNILNDLFDRNMIKYPVMYTNYGAGKANIVSKMLINFDKQFCTLLANPEANSTQIKLWFNNLIKLTGQSEFTFTLLRRTDETPTYITVNANGDVIKGLSSTGFAGSTNIFNNSELMKNIAFEHARNASVKAALEPVLTNLYQAMVDSLDALNTPYKMATESAQTIAEVFNEVVKHQIEKYLKDPVSPDQYLRLVHTITENTLDILGNIIHIGGENGSQLRTMKDAVASCISEALSIYVTTKDGQYYSRVQQVVAAKESLGAGNIPMMVHSYDSYIMHQFLNFMLTQRDTTILSIHDAIVAPPSAVGDSWVLNRGHYASGIDQLGTFGCIVHNLDTAKNNLDNSKLGLDKELKQKLMNKLQYAQDRMFTETLSLMQQSLQWLRQQRSLPRDQRVPNNQYSYRARSAYRPEDADLDRIIQGLETSMQNLVDSENAIPIAERRIVEAINDSALPAHVKQSFIADGHLSEAIMGGVHSVTDLVDSVNRHFAAHHFYVDLAGLTNQINTDPSVQKFRELMTALSGAASTTTPNTVTERDVQHVMSGLKSAARPSIQQFADAVFTMKNYMTQHLIFTGRDSDTFIQRQVTSALIRWIKEDKPRTASGLLRLMREATGLHRLSREQNTAYERIYNSINAQHIAQPVWNTFSTTEDFTLHMSDDLHYEQLLNSLTSRATYSNLKGTAASADAFIEDWYKECVKKHMEETYRGYNGQVVFTLRSNFEELEMKALTELTREQPALFNGTKIVVSPGICNIHEVSSEVYFYQELCQRSSAVNKRFIYRTSPSKDKNSDLLSIAFNEEISEANLTNGNTVAEEPHIYMVNMARNGKKYVTVDEFLKIMNSGENIIQRMDEHGYSNSVTQAQQLTAFDLQREGIRGNSDLIYDFSDVVNLTEEEAQERVNQGQFTPYDVSDELTAVTGSVTENLYGDDASAVVINTTSDGEILGQKVKHAYETNAYFQEAYQKFSYILKTRQQDFDNHKLANFSAVMMPILIKVKTKLGRSKVFVFNPALQTGLTRQALMDSFAEKGNADTFRDQILADSPLYNMLAYKYKATREGIEDIRHFILSHSAGNPADIIQIPARFLADTYKEDLNTSSEMTYKSALGLEKVLQDVAKMGYNLIYIPYNNINIYNEETPKILPDIPGMQYQFLDLSTRNSAYDRQLNAGLEGQERGFIQNLMNSFTEGRKAAFRSWKDRKGSILPQDGVQTDEVTDLHGYRGRVDQAVLGTLQEHLHDGQDVVRTIQDALTDDLSRGVNNGLIQELLPTFRTLNTAIALYTSNQSLIDSFSLVSNQGTVMETNVISIGNKLAGVQSKAEVVSHETIHTILRHLGRDTRLLREAQEVYDFIQRNLKITDFDDGDTLANRAIMEAVFSNKTEDNIEECICYYLTNEAFHNAVNKMNTRVNKVSIISKVKSILQRVVEAITSFINGDSVKGMDVQAAMNHIFQECTVLNNKYWENKNYLKEMGKEDLANPVHFDINTVVRAGSSATEKLLYTPSSETLTGAALAVHDQSYIDEIADSVRDLADVEAGFTNDLIATLQGVSHNQLPYLKMRLMGKKQVDKMREEASATINNLVNKVLGNVSAKVKNKLVIEFMRPDISCIFKYNETDKAYSYVTDKKARTKRITELENSLKTDSWYHYYINCAQGLASYLVTGFNPTGLGYVNAYEIVAKAGSSHQQSVMENGSIHNAVDELISLYALDLLEAKKPVSLSKIDKETLRQLADIHNSVKDAEDTTIDGNKFAKLHVPKGEIHTTSRLHDYRIINAAEYEAYKWAGYTKVSDAELDPFTKAHFPDNKYIMVKALFKSNVPIEAGCSILTDVFKGRLKGGITVDDITDENFHEGTGFKELQNYVNQRVTSLNKPNPALLTTPTSGNLVLHFNSLNRLSGAKFEINPMENLKQTNANARIASAMGNLYGSVTERKSSTDVNKKVAQSVIDIYENADDKENFEWISESSENEDYREYYKNLPPAIKNAITEKYKDKGIPIRKSALNTFFGYRHLSANDTKTFIENERKAQANIDGLASNFKVAVRNLFYNKYVGYGEALSRYLAHVGKENILIKGISTSWFNIVSNYILLGLNGLSPVQALKYETEGIQQFLQIRDYNEKLKNLNQKKIMSTYTDLDARTEKGIKDALHKLPMYHLYAQGLIGDTLAEDLTESDRFIMNTIDKYTSKGPINTLLHNAVMDPQGILYDVLSDFASLGDVAGKYALYRYNREKGMKENEAVRRSLNSFIDYSNPLPKSLQLLDDLAVMPFMKYALGIQNVIADSLIRHPERSLAWLFASNMIDFSNDIFGSLLGFDSLANRLQVPGKLFKDSLKTLPSVRLYDAITD